MFKVVTLVDDSVLSTEKLSELQRQSCLEHCGKTPKGSLPAKAQPIITKSSNTIACADPFITEKLNISDNEVEVSDDLKNKIQSMYGKHYHGRIPKGSFAAKLQSLTDRLKSDNDHHLHAKMVQLEPFPVTKEAACQRQSYTQRKYGIVPKGSTAALTQSAWQQTENNTVVKSLPKRKKSKNAQNLHLGHTKLSKVMSEAAKLTDNGEIQKGSALADSQSWLDSEDARNAALSENAPNVVNSAITARPDAKR